MIVSRLPAGSSQSDSRQPGSSLAVGEVGRGIQAALTESTPVRPAVFFGTFTEARASGPSRCGSPASWSGP